MYVKCLCAREFDVDISHAGHEFRCPHCGRRTAIPGTALQPLRNASAIAVIETICVNDATGETAATQGKSSSRIAADLVGGFIAGVAALLVLNAASWLGLLRLSADRTSAIQETSLVRKSELAKDGNSVVGQENTQPPAVSGIADLVPDTGMDSDISQPRFKAPIEMRDEEFKEILKPLVDEGLPPWWFDWPYNDKNPWLNALACQLELHTAIDFLESHNRKNPNYSRSDFQDDVTFFRNEIVAGERGFRYRRSAGYALDNAIRKLRESGTSHDSSESFDAIRGLLKEDIMHRPDYGDEYVPISDNLRPQVKRQSMQ